MKQVLKYLWGKILKIIDAAKKSITGARVAKAFEESVKATELTSKEPLLNVGWGPKTTLHVDHVSNSNKPLQLFNPDRWDVEFENANPNGVWFQGNLGVPRARFGNGNKGIKAAKARMLFQERPFTHSGELTLEKPIITIGDTDRTSLGYTADYLGADGVIYNDVYDNGYNHNQVIHSFKLPENLKTNGAKTLYNPYKVKQLRLRELARARGVGNNLWVKSTPELNFTYPYPRVKRELTPEELAGIPKHERIPQRPHARDYLVGNDGTINRKVFFGITKDIAKEIPNFFKLMKTPYSSTEGTTTLARHIAGVTKSAQEVPLPQGVTRGLLVRAAIAHDIGKVTEGTISEENHGNRGARFLLDRSLHSDLYHEFLDPKVSLAIQSHMPGDASPVPLPKHSEAPHNNLIRALRLADVARGLNLNLIALSFPNLFMYAKQGPKPKLFTGTEEEQINWFNKWARKHGYPGVPKGHENPRAFIEETMNRHNTFYRGIRDPKVNEREGFYDKRNAKNADKLVLLDRLEKGLPTEDLITSEDRLRVATERVPINATGSGRADLFNEKGDGYKGTTISRVLGLDPARQDALYVSPSPDVVKSYATTARQRPSAVFRVRMPFEPMRLGESIPEFVVRSDFTLFNGNKLKNFTPVDINRNKRINRTMSDYEMIDLPYFELTGRSFSTDFNEWAINKAKLEGTFEIKPPKEYKYRSSKMPMAYKDDEINLLRKIFEEIIPEDSRLSRFGSPIDEEFRYVPHDIDKYLQTAKLLREAFNYLPLKTRYPLELDGYGISVPDPILQQVVARRNIQPIKLVEELLSDKLLKAYLDLYRKSGMGVANKVFSKTIARNLLKKYMDDLFELANIKSGKIKLPKARPYFPTSPALKLQFLQEKGVLPRWMYPNFGKRLAIGSNSEAGMGYGYLTRNYLGPHRGSPQLYIPGYNGEKLLEVVNEISSDRLNELIKQGGFNKTTRDSGRRYVGEDPDVAVSRKLFKMGGKMIPKHLKGSILNFISKLFICTINR